MAGLMDRMAAAEAAIDRLQRELALAEMVRLSQELQAELEAAEVVEPVQDYGIDDPL